MISGLNELLDYTEWQRDYWADWLRSHDPSTLDVSAGSGGDGRFESVRDLIKHVFWAEKRYMERLSGLPLTDHSAVPAQNAEELFAFGQGTRAEFRRFLEEFPDANADTPQQMTILNRQVTVSPRKIVMHVLLHEIRHWAQIATLMRLNGLAVDFQDFLFSPVLGSDVRRQAHA